MNRDFKLSMRMTLKQGGFTLEVDTTSQTRVLGLYGPSGSGKTSWLESLAGLRRPDQGRISCGDAVWLDTDQGICLPPDKRGIGYVPQDGLLFPHWSIRQNLLAGVASPGESPFDEVCRVLELEELLDRRPDQVSGGQKQRVALGRALCIQPKLLLLDEPLSALDVALRNRVLTYLLRIRDYVEIPMVVVSHNPFELMTLCDEVIALGAGRVLDRGAPSVLFSQAAFFPYASQEGGLENLWQARVVECDPHGAKIRLGEEGRGASLRVNGFQGEINQRIRVGISSRELMIATEDVPHLSARNRIPGQIERLQQIGNETLVTLTLAPDLSAVVELTQEAVRDLQMAPGLEVFLLCKSTALVVWD